MDVCQAVVDELANAQTSGDGREEMSRCATAFNQVVWLWGRMWPAVVPEGEQEASTGVGEELQRSIIADGDDADEDADGIDETDGDGERRGTDGEPSFLSPYDGTGM